MKSDIIRRCVFRPYSKGKGPVFGLTMWDTNKRDSMGKYVLGYRLTMGRPMAQIVVFQDQDFACSPLHAVDSDATVTALMGFLTLRPGDTDAEYFDAYSADQLAFAEEHAEALAAEVSFRFPEEGE